MTMATFRDFEEFQYLHHYQDFLTLGSHLFSDSDFWDNQLMHTQLLQVSPPKQQQKEVSPTSESLLNTADIISSALALADARTCDECKYPFTGDNCPEVFQGCGHMVCNSCFKWLSDFCEGKCTRCHFKETPQEPQAAALNGKGHDVILSSTTPTSEAAISPFKVPTNPVPKSTSPRRQNKRKNTERKSIGSKNPAKKFLLQPQPQQSFESATPTLQENKLMDNTPQFYSDLFGDFNWLLSETPKTNDGNLCPSSISYSPPESQCEPDLLDFLNDSDSSLTPKNPLAPTITRPDEKNLLVQYPVPVEFVMDKEEPVAPGSPEKRLFRYSITADSVTVQTPEKTCAATALHCLKEVQVNAVKTGNTPTTTPTASSLHKRSKEKAKKVQKEYVPKVDDNVPTILIGSNGKIQRVVDRQAFTKPGIIRYQPVIQPKRRSRLILLPNFSQLQQYRFPISVSVSGPQQLQQYLAITGGSGVQ